MEKLYSLKEAAEYLNVSTKTIRNYLKSKKLPFQLEKTKSGFKYRFSQKVLENLLLRGNTFQVEVPGNIENVDSLVEKKVENKGTAHMENLENTFLSENSTINPKELLFRYEQAMIRIGQLESQRLMLTERAESLRTIEEDHKKEINALREALIKREVEKEVLEKEYTKTIETLKEILSKEKEALVKERMKKEILAKKLEAVTKKKWWQFWKKPISQLFSEPSQL